MSEHTFEDIYKSVQNLEAGSFVTFNGFPMVVETQTTTYNRYYGELRWVNQLDGKLQIDVTVRVGINLDSEVTRLKAEIECLKDEVGLMNQLWEKHLTPKIRKAMVEACKKQTKHFNQ
jgi:hypothetical protein